MTTPIDNSSSTFISGSAMATVKREVSAPATSPSTPAQDQRETVASSVKSDTVNISSRAVEMSKSLQEKHDVQAALKRRDERRSESVGVAHASVAMVKKYPPFLGNNDQLQALKQLSPGLYKEVLKMIEPPPVDLSYSDAQYLKNTEQSAKAQ